MLKFNYCKSFSDHRKPFYLKKSHFYRSRRDKSLQTVPRKAPPSSSPNTVYLMTRPVKYDIRRKYVEMYCNSLNSGDPFLLQSFFRTFAEDSLSLKKRFEIETKELINSTEPIRFDGVETIMTFFASNNMISPDVTLRIGKSELKESPIGSVILYQFFASGTQLYDVTAFKVMEKVCQVKELFALRSLEVFEHPSFLSYWASVPLLPNPVPFTMHGLIEMDLNQRNLIEVLKYRVYYSLGFSSSPF